MTLKVTTPDLDVVAEFGRHMKDMLAKLSDLTGGKSTVMHYTSIIDPAPPTEEMYALESMCKTATMYLAHVARMDEQNIEAACMKLQSMNNAHGNVTHSRTKAQFDGDVFTLTIQEDRGKLLFKQFTDGRDGTFAFELTIIVL